MFKIIEESRSPVRGSIAKVKSKGDKGQAYFYVNLVFFNESIQPFLNYWGYQQDTMVVAPMRTTITTISGCHL